MDFSGVYDYETLAAAVTVAKELSDPGTFLDDLDENIIKFQNDLIWKTYKISPLENGTKFSFRDIVVQASLCLTIEKDLIRLTDLIQLIGTKELFNKLLTYETDDDITKLIILFMRVFL